MMIGRSIKITYAQNKTLLNKHGEVIDETKNTITIKTDKGNKTIIKEQIEATE